MDVELLERKTVKELRDLAKDAGIAGFSRMKKDELVARLAQGAEVAAVASSASPVAAEQTPVAAPKPVTRKKGTAKAPPEPPPPAEHTASPAGVDAPPAAFVADAPGDSGAVPVPVAVAVVAPLPVASQPPAVAPTPPAPATPVTAAPVTPAPRASQQALPEDLPEAYPGNRLRAMVRDPGTVYVYWEQPTSGSEGWEVAALDPNGQVLDAFRTEEGGTSGYLRVPHGALGQIQLRRVDGEGAPAHVASTWLASPRSTRSADRTQRWVEVPSAAPSEVRVVSAERLAASGLGILDVGQTHEDETQLDLPSSHSLG